MRYATFSICATDGTRELCSNYSSSNISRTGSVLAAAVEQRKSRAAAQRSIQSRSTPGRKAIHCKHVQHRLPLPRSRRLSYGSQGVTMATPRIEAIALVGSRSQRIYMATRIAAAYDKQQQQQQRNKGEENAASSSQSGGTPGLTPVRVHDEVLRLEYAAHCALDIVEERSSTKGANGELVPSNATYLGLVLTLEDLAIYAMTTSTRLRILVVLCPGEARIRDIDCVTILRAIHTSYLSYISNPFLTLPPSKTRPHEPAPLDFGQSNAHIEIKDSALFDRRIAAIGGWI